MVNNKNLYERYGRQILLKQFGETGQLKLLNSKVLVIGAGGLGCPTLQYLTAAGIGTIGIVDDDIISLSNLQRQILYKTTDIGLSKAECAASILHQLNPQITIIPHNIRLNNSNALELISEYEIIIDCTDNFSTRYLINDACVLKKKALIYGSVFQFEGQVAIFNVVDKNGIASVNYRDLFPVQPEENEIQSCNEAGVIGVLPGMIGIMMANECIKLITQLGKPLINKLAVYNALKNQLIEVVIPKNKESNKMIPANEMEFKAMQNSFLCSTENLLIELDVEAFDNQMNQEDTVVIDVREVGEKPMITAFNYIHIPLSILLKEKQTIPEKNILLFCHSGIRSINAGFILSDKSKKLFHLKGGIVAWMEHHKNK